MNFQKRQGLFDRRQNERILALDFGGTWLKGVYFTRMFHHLRALNIS